MIINQCFYRIVCLFFIRSCGAVCVDVLAGADSLKNGFKSADFGQASTNLWSRKL